MKGNLRTDCKFYDMDKHECKALNELYCEKSKKPCRFCKLKDKTTESEGK